MAINLNDVKEQLQTILQTANTTTATQDLSNGLETRVQRVLKVNPARIPVQSTWYPFVTIYVGSKDVDLEDFAGTQSAAKRRANVNLQVVGAVWNSSITDEEVDPADEDCEKLMENIEEIIRNTAANSTLNGVANWTRPVRVSYHNVTLDEGVHVRAGLLTLEANIFY